MSMIARSCVITVVLANTAAAEVEGGGVPCGVNKWWPHWGEFSAHAGSAALTRAHDAKRCPAGKINVPAHTRSAALAALHVPCWTRDAGLLISIVSRRPHQRRGAGSAVPCAVRRVRAPCALCTGPQVQTSPAQPTRSGASTARSARRVTGTLGRATSRARRCRAATRCAPPAPPSHNPPPRKT